MPIQNSIAAKMLVNIFELQNQRIAELDQFNVNGKLVESDVENDAENATYDAFSDSGNANEILKITSSSPSEIRHHFSECREELEKKLSGGPRKAQYFCI